MNRRARGGGNSNCRWAGILIVADQAGNSLNASAELRDRQVHQRRSMLKEQLRDRSLRPSRQHPSFILPPVSQRLEAGGRVPCQEKGTRGLARLVLSAAGGNLNHRVQGEDPPDTEPGSSHRHTGRSGSLAGDSGNLPVRSYDLRRPLVDPCHRGHSYVPTDSASLRVGPARTDSASLCVSHDVFPPWSTG